ncbi:alpha/beta hydrolase [Flavobacterium sp. MAH-1]|uniref:Alpha/beta hydrolase n=1 Tax=Flavobacterium agri TaxID=2743471 RepID=A0A7Y8XZ92_9FLAO|nr:alpha/beta hydrolase [Flavobacterium agri]NUY79462.1 alpha/beta hydrolase [Flavobacterium agri]NYA69487.1 alpha/beta hydrolase [Flavobacterium agri]
MKSSISKKIIIAGLFLLLLQNVFAQQLYVKTFGNAKDKAVIFLHGGPGYNSASFEVTTAKPLSEKGFFVIVYDRRGEGRSVDANAKFNFEQTLVDLDGLYSTYHLNKATLIGHSFGGMVGTEFTKKHPEKVNALILVGAPVNLQESFDQIVSRCRKIYEDKKDEGNLNYIGMLEKMDKSSMEYASYCFGHAMYNGFYSTKNPSEESKKLFADLKNSPESAYASKMTVEPPKGFWQNDHYTTLDLTATLSQLVAKKVKIYGLYGKEDGLYATSQIEKLRGILGKNNLKYLENCSHSVFIDQQTTFLQSISEWAK